MPLLVYGDISLNSLSIELNTMRFINKGVEKKIPKGIIKKKEQTLKLGMNFSGSVLLLTHKLNK